MQDSLIIEDAVIQKLIATLPHLSVQDVLTPENVVLLGLIAEMTSDPVQDLMAKTLPRLFSRGKHALNSWLLSKVQQSNTSLPAPP